MKVTNIEVGLIDSMGTDLSVVNAARVSFSKESDWEVEHVERDCGKFVVRDCVKTLKQSDVKLINYLAKHKHYSPFNHTFITVRVKAPLYVARQLVKHEYMPWNEVSRRYVNTEPEFGEMTFRWAADNVKQGSGEEVDEMTQACAHNIFFNAAQVALEAYEKLLEMGICAEQARAILPVDQQTEWIWSGTLKAFHKMLSLRLDPHTQKEATIVATKCKELIEPLFPISLKALLENA
jgi:thymidylate synthase (FAD)